MKTKCEDLALTRSPARRLASLIEHAHCAARLTSRVLVTTGDYTPRLLADVALRTYACLRNSRFRAAERYADAIPRLSRLVLARDGDGLLSRQHMEEQVLLDMAAFERSTVPTHHKASRRGQLARHHAAVRAQQRRLELTTWYKVDCTMCVSLDEIRLELHAKWAPAFRQHHGDQDAVNIFFPYAQSSGLDPSWEWARGEPRDIAAHSRDSAPGTDGLGYSFWAHAPDPALDLLDDIAVAARHRTPLPARLHQSRTVSIPKAELLADPDDVRLAADTLRPLCKITTGDKLIALVVNRALAPVAERTVAPPQKGFVSGRLTSEDIIGLDGAMAALSLLLGSRAAAVLFDFANAFPVDFCCPVRHEGPDDAHLHHLYALH